jgi:hypothetical protein
LFFSFFDGFVAKMGFFIAIGGFGMGIVDG